MGWALQKLAKEQWRWHRRIRIFLIFDIIDVGALEGLIAGEHSSYYYYTCDSGSVCHTLEAVGFVVFIILTGIVFYGFVSNYTRKAEIFEIANMEYRVVKVELKALLDEIKNCKDDDDEVLRRKHGELTRKVTEVTKWAEITKFRLRHPRTIKSDPETW